MKKSFLVLAILFSLIGQANVASASAITEPSCFVKAEVINVGSETRKLDTGKEYKSGYLDFKILEVNKKEDCSIERDQVYRISDNYQGMLKKGDKISAAISFCDAMGPSGVVSFLHWSKVTYEDGSPIKNANNVVIDFLQSPQEPLT